MSPRSNLSLEVPGVPYLSSEFSKTMNKWRFAVLIVFRDKEEVPQGSNSHQRLNCDIHKVRLLNVI